MIELKLPSENSTMSSVIEPKLAKETALECV